MALVTVHDTDVNGKNANTNTTNLGLKSISYNSYRSYAMAMEGVRDSITYIAQSKQYSTALTNTVNSLTAATNMLINLVRAAMVAKGRESLYNDIREKWDNAL